MPFVTCMPTGMLGISRINSKLLKVFVKSDTSDLLSVIAIKA